MKKEIKTSEILDLLNNDLQLIDRAYRESVQTMTTLFDEILEKKDCNVDENKKKIDECLEHGKELSTRMRQTNRLKNQIMDIIYE